MLDFVIASHACCITQQVTSKTFLIVHGPCCTNRLFGAQSRGDSVTNRRIALHLQGPLGSLEALRIKKNKRGQNKFLCNIVRKAISKKLGGKPELSPPLVKQNVKLAFF